MIRQLRIYEIFEDTKDAFHARFRDHASRIMATHGFRIVGAWESTTDGTVEFTYVLEWPDEATMRDRWAAFMADEEWAQVKQDTAAGTGPMVGAIQDRVLVPVGYLPEW
jgi:heme-degrading monooxygenase HmoA